MDGMCWRTKVKWLCEEVLVREGGESGVDVVDWDDRGIDGRM